MSPAGPGAFLAFAATVLLVFTCVTPPTWDKLYFLDVNNGQLQYGCLGFTGHGPVVGYDLDQAGFHDIGTTTLNNLTYALILHPIAAGLAGLSFIFGVCNVRVGTIFMTLSSGLAAVVTLVVFVIDMALWGTVRQHFQEQGISASYGIANWLTAAALGALLGGFFASCCGIFGSYRKRNISGE